MNQREEDQLSIRCVLMRGGTSKGLYFRNENLPVPGQRRDRLLQRLMGSPDVVQIDGLGGSRPITSKLAIVSNSQRADADVDYTFAQVSIDTNAVGYSGNCGNISSGVGPFAVDEGLVEVVEGNTRVRIFNTNTNTNAVIVSDVPVRNDKARVLGSFTIPGVPGGGAEIAMNWVGTVGAKTGKLLPTGNAIDKIKLEDQREVDVSIVDAANPLVFVHASDFGISGSELVDEVNANNALLSQVREVRGKAAVLIGMAKEWETIDETSPGLPMLALIAAPADYKTLSGEQALADRMDVRSRVIFINRLHESVPGTGSICLAAASCVKGSVLETASAKRKSGVLLIGTPSGITPARVEAHDTPDAPFVAFDVLGFSRTARRLMDSSAFYPADLFDTLEDRVGIPIQNSGVGVVYEE